MKLIFAIVRNDNEDDVTAALNSEHFVITKLSTVGGFLRKGNVTLLIVTEDEHVDEAISIIKKECGESQDITVNMPYISGTGMLNSSTVPVKVKIGGATVFVTDVERFEKF
ncbi:MAG: cyclic-di-AMP receptor [Eubacteriales bacterium]|nr:cyclic-di-AMP receptor [Eubacteriales bacterium]